MIELISRDDNKDDRRRLNRGIDRGHNIAIDAVDHRLRQAAGRQSQFWAPDPRTAGDRHD